MKNNSSIANAMGTQYEIYINTLRNKNSNVDFENIYKEEFYQKYKKILEIDISYCLCCFLKKTRLIF